MTPAAHEEFHRIKRLPPYVFAEVNRLKAEYRAEGVDIIDFGMGNPDMDTPSHIVEKLVETVRKPRTHRYSSSKGIPGLRRAQAGYYERRFGVTLNPETEVIATLGSKEGLANLAMAVTAPGDVILAGSSMGGWASLLAMRQRPERVKAMILIAPAPDFTEKLMWANWNEEAKRAVMEEGIHYEPSEYDEPYEYSRELIEDGRENLLLDAPYVFDGPVRILQGIQDAVVPWTYAQQLLDVITSEDMTLTLVKSGDHSLSRPEDLERLVVTVEELLNMVAS